MRGLVPCLGLLIGLTSSSYALLTTSCNPADLTELGLHSGKIPDESLNASSYSDSSHMPRRGRLNQVASGRQGSSWCAENTDKKQWFTVDLVAVRKVTHIATQGQYDPQNNGSVFDTSWVTEYALEYSTDGKTYHYYSYKEDYPLVIKGNSDGNTVACRTLPYPINVQYLRIRPTAWNAKKICLRVGLFGEMNGAAAFVAPVIPTAPYLNDDWWWTFFWVLISFLVLALIVFLFLYFCYIRKRKEPRYKTYRKEVKPKSLPRKPQSAYTNEAYDMTVITQSHTTTVVMPEEAEEMQEDEVQEVTAEFNEDEVAHRRGIMSFSVSDEDEQGGKKDEDEDEVLSVETLRESVSSDNVNRSRAI